MVTFFVAICSWNEIFCLYHDLCLCLGVVVTEIDYDADIVPAIYFGSSCFRN